VKAPQAVPQVIAVAPSGYRKAMDQMLAEWDSLDRKYKGLLDFTAHKQDLLLLAAARRRQVSHG
jgi:hypothetical protein